MSQLAYFAVITRSGAGHAPDAYPEELDRYRRELHRDGSTILGLYGTCEAAIQAVMDALRAAP